MDTISLTLGSFAGLRLLDSWVLGFLLCPPLDRLNVLSIKFISDDESYFISRKQRSVKIMVLTSAHGLAGFATFCAAFMTASISR